jgi:hypothetical protein
MLMYTRGFRFGIFEPFEHEFKCGSGSVLNLTPITLTFRAFITIQCIDRATPWPVGDGTVRFFNISAINLGTHVNDIVNQIP